MFVLVRRDVCTFRHLYKSDICASPTFVLVRRLYFLTFVSLRAVPSDVCTGSFLDTSIETDKPNLCIDKVSSRCAVRHIKCHNLKKFNLKAINGNCYFSELKRLELLISSVSRECENDLNLTH